MKTGKANTLTEDSDVSEIVWLGTDDSSILYINSTNAEIPGGVELWVSDTSDFASGYKAASLPASFSGLKTARTHSGDIHYVVNGKSYPNGTAYNEKLAATPLSTARIYDSIYVRHWDYWLSTTFNAIFSGSLKKANRHHGQKYTADGDINNLVYKIKNLESPYPPYAETSDYDISPNGKWVAFKSKAPELPKANYTASYIYLSPHDGSEKPAAINGPDSPGTPEGVKGDSASPVFSPDSRHIAYLQMSKIKYEADRNIMYVHTIGSKKTSPSAAKNWDRSPGRIKFAANGKELLASTDDRARTRLFSVPVDAGDDFKPKNFTDGGSVSEFYHLPGSSVLVTGSSMWTNWIVYTASPKKGVMDTISSANKIDPELKGLGPADIDEFYFKGNRTDVRPLFLSGYPN